MRLVALVALLFSFSTANAYYAIMDTGKIIPSGKYRVIAGPQFITTGENDGTNISGRFDAGVGESTTLRLLAGGGTSDLFYSGLSVKYIPYPDFENQPAIGFTTGITYAKETVSRENEDVLTIRFAPLVSKDFETDIGLLTPYGALPLSLTLANGDTHYPVHFAAGTEFKPYSWEGVSFMAELGAKLNKAFNYVSLAVVFEFDDSNF